MTTSPPMPGRTMYSNLPGNPDRKISICVFRSDRAPVALKWLPSSIGTTPSRPVSTKHSTSVTTISGREDTADFIYWLYADLDHVFVVSKIVSTYYGHYSGSIKRFWSSTVVITKTAIVNGSVVVAQVNDASIFTPDQHYIIKDDASIERIKIIAIDTVATPNIVIIEIFASDYATGTKIGEDPQPVITGYYSMPNTFYAVNKFDGWSSITGQAGSSATAYGNFQNASNQDKRYGLLTMFSPYIKRLQRDAR